MAQHRAAIVCKTGMAAVLPRSYGKDRKAGEAGSSSEVVLPAYILLTSELFWQQWQFVPLISSDPKCAMNNNNQRQCHHHAFQAGKTTTQLLLAHISFCSCLPKMHGGVPDTTYCRWLHIQDQKKLGGKLPLLPAELGSQQ